MPKFERNQAVTVMSHGYAVAGTIAESGPMGREMPFYPDSTVTKYGNGSMGRTAWGYKVRAPMIDPETGEPRRDARGSVIMGIGYVETSLIEA